MRTTVPTTVDILDSSDEDSCDEAADECVPCIKLKSKRTKLYNTRTKKTNSSFSFVDYVKLVVTETPTETHEYLIKLKEVKRINM